MDRLHIAAGYFHSDFSKGFADIPAGLDSGEMWMCRIPFWPNFPANIYAPNAPNPAKYRPFRVKKKLFGEGHEHVRSMLVVNGIPVTKGKRRIECGFRQRNILCSFKRTTHHSRMTKKLLECILFSSQTSS